MTVSIWEMTVSIWDILSLWYTYLLAVGEADGDALGVLRVRAVAAQVEFESNF